MAEDLRALVEKIVAEVMRRIERDPELSPMLRRETAEPKPQWARTCSAYRKEESAPVTTLPKPVKRLYCESDIHELLRSGISLLEIDKKTILTPAARDAAAAKGLTIRVRE